jgi:hypothetical protein
MAMTDSKFREAVRMEKSTFKKLVDEIGPHFVQQGSVNGKSLQPVEKILLFMLYLSGDKFYWDQEYSHEISKSAALQAIKQCVSIFFDVFVPSYIKMPTPDQAKKEARLFSQNSAFPPVIFAAIDGCHVRVNPKKDIRVMYRNRYGTLSFNVLVLAGATGRVFYVKSNSPGSCNDNQVLKSSELWNLMESGEGIPFEGGVIAGDGAYPIYKKWLVTPFKYTTRNEEEAEFNTKYNRARGHVEQVFGRVKNKFPVLLRELRAKDMVTCAKTIQICFAISNFIIEHEQGEEDDLDGTFNPYENAKSVNMAGRKKIATNRKLLEQFL